MWEVYREFFSEENFFGGVLLFLKFCFRKNFVICSIKVEYIFLFVIIVFVVFLTYFKINLWFKKKKGRNICVWVGEYFKVFYEFKKFFIYFLSFIG